MSRFSRLLLLFAAAASLCFGSARADELSDHNLPWGLRVHYSFPAKGMVLDYDEKTSRIRIGQGEANTLVDDMEFAIQFADGLTWTFRDLGEGKTEREPANDPHMGAATSYTTTYPLKNGLQVRYVLVAFSKRPFLSLELQLENQGTSEVRVSALDPLLTGATGVTNLSPEARVRERKIGSRGGYPVFDPNGDPIMTVFSNPSNRAIFALGIIPEGKAASGTRFEPRDGAWHGRVMSRFTPPLRLAPGEKLSSDRVCVIYGSPQQGEIDLFYSWALSVVDRPKDNRKGPSSWITIPEEQGLNDLVADVRAWSGSGIKHALVPVNWESRPGSMKGASPRYPGNMKSAVDELKGAGAGAGLTLDPLAVDDGPGAAVAESPDGLRWLNPASPESQDFARRRFSKLGDWGYGFVVAAPSAVPDPVLESWNLTRTEANHLALNLLEEATGERPVYPASAGALRAARADWLEAASALGRLADYGAGLGPIRLDTRGLGGVDSETVSAMRLWRGPIEVSGRPDGGGVKALAALFQLPRLDASAVDIDRKDPLVWQIAHEDDQGQVGGQSVLAFSGTEGLRSEHLYSQNGIRLRLWDPQSKATVPDGEATTAPQLKVYGTVQELPHPSFLSAVDMSTLQVPDVKYLQWDGGANTFRGAFDSGVGKDTIVSVHVPAGWQVDGAEVGGKKSSGATAGQAYLLQLSGSTTFEVKFRRG